MDPIHGSYGYYFDMKLVGFDQPQSFEGTGEWTEMGEDMGCSARI